MTEDATRWFRRHKGRLEAAVKWLGAVRIWCKSRKVGLDLRGGPHIHDCQLIFRHQFGRRHGVAVWKPALAEVWRAYGAKGGRSEHAHLHTWFDVQKFLEDWLVKGANLPRQWAERDFTAV